MCAIALIEVHVLSVAVLWGLVVAYSAVGTRSALSVVMITNATPFAILCSLAARCHYKNDRLAKWVSRRYGLHMNAVRYIDRGLRIHRQPGGADCAWCGVAALERDAAGRCETCVSWTLDGVWSPVETP